MDVPGEAPNAVKVLLDSIELIPPPPIVDAGFPLELKLKQAAGLTDALSTVKALGSYTLDLASVALPGLGLDPAKNAFIVDLEDLDLGNNVQLSLGQLEVKDISLSTVMELATKNAVSHHPPFSSTLSRSAAAGDTSVTIAAAPAPAQMLSLDGSGNSEIRTVRSVTGEGPFIVALDAPLAGAHPEGASVTQALAFLSVLSEAAVAGATQVKMASAPAPGPSAPQPGQVLEIDSSPLAEMRTVRAVSGNGPYTVTLAEPLATPHLIGAKVTQFPTFTASTVQTAEPVLPVTSGRTLQLGTRLLGVVGAVKGSIGKIGAAATLVQGLPGSITGSIRAVQQAARIRLPALRQIPFTSRLSAASAIGATSITTVDPLRPGVVVHIDIGTAAETRTVVKVSASGPFTATLVGPPLEHPHEMDAPVAQLQPLGQIKLALSQDAVLPKPPDITMKWEIKSPDNGQHFVPVANALEGVLAAPPTIVFLPQFAALGAETMSGYSISCTVTAKGTNPVSGENYELPITLGPVSVRVPQIGIPTVAVMTEHPRDHTDYPGAVLVAVPENYPSIDWRELLKPISNVQHVLALIVPLLPSRDDAPDIPDYPALSSALTELVGLLNVQPSPETIIRRNKVLDLFGETSAPGWPHNWNDKISGIIIAGPPSSSVIFHNRFNLWFGSGQFRVQLGSLPAAVLPSLNFATQNESDKLAAIPPGTKVFVEHDSDVGTFNDVVSSYQFA